MSQQDPGAAAPRRGRRRHAPVRRGPGPGWLIAAGGVGLLGLGAVLFTGGSGPRGGSPADGGSGGPPALIQGDAPSPDAGPGDDAAPPPAVPASAPSTATRTPGPTTAPSGKTSASAAPTATPASGTGDETGDETGASDAGSTEHPGRGRGLAKRPR
ncbi:hypothetical protein AB0424_23805 [Streptomyces sp. NPDC051180]|uniref:hypothetical protein n=1 Tax=Streptomyces sp. NPDC051180 TaxID=3155797 RepID=UPI0034502635